MAVMVVIFVREPNLMWMGELKQVSSGLTYVFLKHFVKENVLKHFVKENLEFN